MYKMTDRHHLNKLTDLYKRMEGMFKHGEFSIHPSNTRAPLDWYLLIEKTKFDFSKLANFSRRINNAGYYLGEIWVTNPKFGIDGDIVFLKSCRYQIEIIKKE